MMEAVRDPEESVREPADCLTPLTRLAASEPPNHKCHSSQQWRMLVGLLERPTWGWAQLQTRIWQGRLWRLPSLTQGP